ncbi:MAG: GGDEF domain-containing protein [Oscillatoria sp. PMC 1051.18]|nr:GGDEF domain-containing protein [Oscillatoria sp. PMC 1051.18]
MNLTCFQDAILNNSSLEEESLYLSRLQAIMDNVLVIGGENFLATLWLENIPYAKVVATEITYRAQLLEFTERHQPKVLIIDASYPVILGWYNELKQFSQFPYIYCLAIAQENSDSPREIVSQLSREAEALENGADAYLRLKRSSVATEAQKRLLEAQIKVGLRQVEKYRELLQTNDYLSSMAFADPLTQISNRRALEWELPRQIENACNQQIPLSLLILDVDYFKSVNDEHGHLVGDRVLQLLTTRLKHHLRVQDTIFRYGGEEFVVLLKQADAPTAYAIAERLRQVICDQAFQIDRNLSLLVTISIGVSTLTATDDPEGFDLLKRADDNLIRAKSTGRNQAIAQ